MKKAIFYKEWIKTRRYFPIALTVSVIFIIYALLGVQRVINFRGVAHLWEILLSRDVVFIETLTYIPLLAGLLLAIVQFVPEMQQKRLKLTLHLPYPQNRMLMLMLIAGLSELIVIYLIDYLILYVYLQNILAPELTDRILLTSASLVYWRYYCLFPDKLDLPRTDLETEDSQFFYQLRYYTDFFPLECSSGI